MSLPKDFFPGVIILAICAWLYTVTTGFDTDPLGMTQGMPATHMPRLVLGVIAALSVLMMIQGWRSGEKDSHVSPPVKMWITAACLGTAAALFETIGVPLAFFSVCVVIPLLWGARNLMVIALFAVVLPIAIYVVFQGLLGLRLPLGPLSMILG